jgi:CP family cyanate transporter-like MFS transporter
MVRLTMPARAGLATAVYGSGYAGSGILAVATAVPILLPLFGGRWQGVFIFWAAVTLLAVAAWLLLARIPDGGSPGPARASGISAPLRSPLLWLVSVIFLCQTVGFHTANSWMVPYYVSLGLPMAAASIPLTMLTVGGLLGGTFAPMLSDRIQARRPTLLLASVFSIVGSLTLALVPLSAPGLWPVLFGIGVASVFTVSLAVPVDVAAREQVGMAAGVILTVGYGISGLAPAAVGGLRDLTGAESSVPMSMAVISAVMFACVLALPETHPGRARGERGAAMEP